MAGADELDNPYPGLRPFQADETHLFFGRDEQTSELLRRLQRSRFLAIVGTSGSGKSSLVRAGLLHGVYGGFMAGGGSQWRVVDLRPGTDPIGNLAHALDLPGALREGGCAREDSFTAATLRRSGLGLVQAVREARLDPGDRVLVLVDQSEELFRAIDADTGARLGDDATAFVKLLLEAARQEELPIYVVLTMRSDFLGECARFPDLPEAISDGQYLIPRLTRDQRREAITGPAKVYGVSLSSTLVNRLLNDVGENPDQLPILQHALMRTWDLWARDPARGKVIDLPNYEDQRIGGMAKALSLHADAVLGSLGEGDAARGQRRRLIAERLFKCLATIGASGREVRRFVQAQEVADIAGAAVDEVIAVVEAFREPRNSFLMPPAGEPLTATTSIDISHESLIRNWSTMRDWLAEEAESARIYQRLAATAVLHANGKAGLWRQPDLGVAIAWRNKQRPGPTWARRYEGDFVQAMDFLDDSNAATAANDNAKARARRIWTAAFAVGLMALLALATNWIAGEVERVGELAWAAQGVADEVTFVRRELKALYLARESGASPDGLQQCKLDGQGMYEVYPGKMSAGTRVIRAWLCDPEAKDLPDGYEPLFEIAQLLHERNFFDADRKVDESPGRVAVPARRLMEAIADMQSPEIHRERCALLGLLKAKAKDVKLPRGCPARQTEVADWAHPVHAVIAEKLKAIGGLNELGGPTLLLLSFYNPANDKLLWERYGRVAPASDMATRPAAPRWMLERMIDKAGEPESQLAAQIDNVRPLLWAFLAVMAWPGWRAWRWWQRRSGRPILPQPGALRRGLAGLFDVGIAVCVGATVGLTVYSTLATMLGAAFDIADAAASILGLLSALAYAVMGDAIRFRHCRSLGKIAFDLRPVPDPAIDRGSLEAAAMAWYKRAASWAIPVMLAPLIAGLAYGIGAAFINDPDEYETELLLGAATFTLVVLLGLRMLWMRVARSRESAAPRAVVTDIPPERAFASDQGRIGLVVSARRSVDLFVAMALTPVGIGLLGEWLPTAEDSVVIGVLVLTGLTLLVLPILLGRGRTPGDRLSGTRVIDAGSDESLRIDAPPRYLSADAGPAAALSATVATAVRTAPASPIA